jgi:hypothetical protein
MTFSYNAALVLFDSMTIEQQRSVSEHFLAISAAFYDVRDAFHQAVEDAVDDGHDMYANAKLMAAAPQLLAAAKLAFHTTDYIYASDARTALADAIEEAE